LTDPQQPGFDTLAIHAGQVPDPSTGSITPPIHQTSTYVQDGIGGLRGGYEYARAGNPTRAALEVQVAALEQGAEAIAFASGLAAEDALLRAVLKPGDRVVLGNDAYGGTYRLLKRIHEPQGIVLETLDLTDEASVEAAFARPARMLWIETPTNPLLRIVDIAALAARAKEHGVLVVVDNTFASPALQQPLLLGADVVVHSVTKYIGGHSDLIGGAVITSDAELIGAIGFLVNAVGAVPGPMDAFLALRGLRTLGVRMRRHSDSAAAIAAYLVGHEMVNQVYYPGLPDHPGHGIAAGQMAAFGGMVSFLVETADEASRIARGTRLFVLAESLGGVESLIELPGPMTHASVSGSDLEVPAELVRLSVGLEHPDDLIADLEQAFG
jgi:cystathionine gamma-synthase